jgi:hypothetical protein
LIEVPSPGAKQRAANMLSAASQGATHAITSIGKLDDWLKRESQQ